MLQRVGLSAPDLQGIAIADERVVATASINLIVPAAALDDVIAIAGFNGVLSGTAKQPVVPIATLNQQVGEVRQSSGLWRVFRIEAPFAVAARKLEFGIGMHFVVATASVDDELLDGVRLEERELLHEGIRRRSGGGLASRRAPVA